MIAFTRLAPFIAAFALACDAAPSAKPTPSLTGEHPYADLYHGLGTVSAVPLRGRVVEERGEPDPSATTPLRQISQDELAGVRITAVPVGADGKEYPPLGEAVSDRDGTIDTAFPAAPGALAPGRYSLDLRMGGVSIGKAETQLLADDDAGVVVRSDIDLTYLDTHFARKQDMLALLDQKAIARRTLPAMAAVYDALRLGASGQEDRPLLFISGSPRFFKRVLEAKMAQDGVAEDGIFLKDFDAVAWRKLTELEPDDIGEALHEQVGYKLGPLLRGRLALPPHATELLLGDDAEADFAAYSIYTRITTGELTAATLGPELKRAGVTEPGTREEIGRLAAQVQAKLGDFHPVQAIFINLTGTPNPAMKVDDWLVPGITHTHAGAGPLIDELAGEGFVRPNSVGDVKVRLLALGQPIAP